MVEEKPNLQEFRIDLIAKERSTEIGEDGTKNFSATLEPDPRRYETILLDGKIIYRDIKTGIEFSLSQLSSLKGAPLYYAPAYKEPDSFLKELQEKAERFTRQKNKISVNNRKTRRRNEFNIKRYLKSVRGKEILVVILYVDLVESTNLSAIVPIEVNCEIIRIFSIYMDLVIRNYRGHIWKSNGDGIIGVFPAEDAFVGKCDNAIQASIMMASVIEKIINPIFVQKGFPEIGFHIGIDVGRVMVVDIDIHDFEESNDLMGYTMNLTSKIQSNAGINEILIGKQLFNLIHVSLQEYFEKKVMSDDWKFPDPTQKTMTYQLYKLRDGIRYGN
jgi:class 3 adenylate cyclase